MRTGGDARFTVLAEIKRPDSKIFSSDKKTYRNGVPGFAPELANAVSQLQVNAHSWDFEGSKRPADQERLLEDRIYTITPRSLLIYGHAREIAQDYDRRKSFELFRSSLSRPEIMTYDEVLERARFIVEERASDFSSSDGAAGLRASGDGPGVAAPSESALRPMR